MAAWALWSSCRQTVNLELRIAAADGFSGATVAGGVREPCGSFRRRCGVGGVVVS